MYLRVSLALSACSLAITGLLAQPQSYPQDQPGIRDRLSAPENPIFEFHLALGWIKQAADDLQEKWDARLTPEGTQRLIQIREDVEFLQARWQSWAADRTRDHTYSGRIKADCYYRSLEGYRRRLKQVLRSRDVADVERAITDVAADMRLKADNCRHSDDGLGKAIEVQVRTLKGTNEVAGYEVWCVPRALLEFKDEHVRFPKISSPSVMANLSPGNYLLWVEKDGLTSDRVPQTIGGGGQKSAEVELLVP